MAKSDKENTTGDMSFGSSFLSHVASTEIEMFKVVY